MCRKKKWDFQDFIKYLPFSYYYIGPVAFATYFLAGRSFLSKNSLAGCVFGILFAAYSLAIFWNNGFLDGLYVLRFYWGFILFYLIFKSNKDMHIDRLLIIISLITLVEAVLINTVIPAHSLPNFPSMEATSHFVAAGDYQRPYSFGGSASVTSVILVAFLAVSRLGWRGKLLVFSAISACMSGSGFIVLIIYFIARTPRIGYLLIVPVIIGGIYSANIYKISPDYIFFLLDFKFAQISDSYSSAFLFIGEPLQASEGNAGGDFAVLNFLQYNGLIGLLFVLVFFLLKINKINWLSVVILLVGTFHYGVIFFFPGQLTLGYFLNLKSRPGLL